MCILLIQKEKIIFLLFLLSQSKKIVMGSRSIMSLKEAAVRIYSTGLHAVLPDSLVQNLMHLQGNTLFLQGKRYDLHRNVYLVGFGKAVLGMAKGVDQLIKSHIVKGIISIPKGLQNDLVQSSFPEARKMLLDNDSAILVKEGALNNLPDEDAIENAILIENLVKKTKEGDLLFVLVSGGGSALLPAPADGISLSEKLRVINLLAKRGATIQELNTVRTKLSRLKGGRLAAFAGGSQVISLILSDIVGDPPTLISSGPTVPNKSTFQDCMNILKSFGVENEIPQRVREFLLKRRDSEKYEDSNVPLNLSNVQNILIGNNKTAVLVCKKAAEELGFKTLVLTTLLKGEARFVGHCFAHFAFAAAGGTMPNRSKIAMELDDKTWSELESLMSKSDRICLITAGETTVSVKGNGRGGRNQELALAAAAQYSELSISLTDSRLADNLKVCLLSSGTDGQDGPTPAAGAFFVPCMIKEAQAQRLDIQEYLDNNASYDFYSALSGGKHLFVTGLTGTNVMDIQMLLISK